jgi:Ni/Co efflux regulator RcnB
MKPFTKASVSLALFVKQHVKVCITRAENKHDSKWKKFKPPERERERERERDRDRDRDRETERQRDRQTDRQNMITSQLFTIV